MDFTLSSEDSGVITFNIILPTVGPTITIYQYEFDKRLDNGFWDPGSPRSLNASELSFNLGFWTNLHHEDEDIQSGRRYRARFRPYAGSLVGEWTNYKEVVAA